MPITPLICKINSFWFFYVVAPYQIFPSIPHNPIFVTRNVPINALALTWLITGAFTLYTGPLDDCDSRRALKSGPPSVPNKCQCVENVIKSSLLKVFYMCLVWIESLEDDLLENNVNRNIFMSFERVIKALSWGLEMQIWIPKQTVHNSKNILSRPIKIHMSIHHKHIKTFAKFYENRT